MDVRVPYAFKEVKIYWQGAAGGEERQEQAGHGHRQGLQGEEVVKGGDTERKQGRKGEERDSVGGSEGEDKQRRP